MKILSLVAVACIVALAGACHSKDSDSDPGDALKIQALDHQVALKIAGALDYAGGLTETERDSYSNSITLTSKLYDTCSENGRKSSESRSVEACADSFQVQLTAVLKDLVETFRRTHAKSFADLNSQVLALSDKGTAIGKDLEKVQATYISCQSEALEKNFQENSGRLLRACELTVDAEIVRIDTAVKTFDVESIDKFIFRSLETE